MKKKIFAPIRAIRGFLTDGIYLRQFFVDRQQRRRGVERRALGVLRAALWPPE